jgi:hypothetical protein
LIRSVHNIRIERLWRDLTLGFAGKWKHFFQHLEFYNDLNHDNPRHIWLLHYLFLESVNEDAKNWAEAWNYHVLSLRHEKNQSPVALFELGMMEHGVRGFMEEDLPEDLAEYGVDWEDFLDDDIRDFFQTNNPPDSMQQPEHVVDMRHMSHVEVEVPNCPFNENELVEFEERISSNYPDILQMSMQERIMVWRDAKAFSGY